MLDLDDTLIHSDWTRERGWRTFKRPGAEDFLRNMAQYYEMVVYTDQLPTYADPILDRLDPNRFAADNSFPGRQLDPSSLHLSLRHLPLSMCLALHQNKSPDCHCQ